jgi:putative ABC transport system permease protein
MLSPRQLLRRLRDASRPRGLERDLDDEVRFHLEMETANNVRRGMAPADARRLAEREFGSVTLVKEEVRDARGATLADDMARDVRFGARSLGRSPGYTAVAVITLALGIGATTAIFTAVDHVLLRPLPYQEPERLVMLFEHNDKGGRTSVSWPNFQDWRARARTIESMAAFRGGPMTVLGAGAPVRAGAYLVTSDFFRVLRVQPVIGRTFAPEETVPGAPPVAVVSHSFWRERLGATRDLSSAKLRIGAVSLAVVGVAPPGFQFPESADIWTPAEPQNGGMGRTGHNDDVIARIADGATVDAARAELSSIAATLKAQYGDGSDAVAAEVVGMHAELVGSVRPYLRLLLAAVVLVLLVACVNLASAGLARATARGREMAIRSALGAGRRRLVRQLLTESMLLALVGGAAGLLVARALLAVLIRLAPEATLAYARDVSLDARILGFAVALAALTGLLIGILPALQVSGLDLRDSIGQGTPGAGSGRGRARRALVVAEVAFALALLAGAGLLARSFRLLLAVPPGFDPANVLTINVEVPRARYPDGQREVYFERVRGALRALPGVRSVGLVNQPPLLGWGMSGLGALGDRPERLSADYRVADAGYFEVMRIPLLAGRLFDATDRPDAAEHAIVISRAMAERFWPAQSPIGKRFRPLGMDQHANVWMHVVGVVGDVHHGGLGTPPKPTLYVSTRQRDDRAEYVTLVVRTAGAPGALAAAVRERLQAVEPEVPLQITTMDDRVARSVADRRFSMIVLTGFGALALVLAAVGIYGVVSYGVVRRTREIGVRMALGAGRGSVVGMVLGESMRPVLLGAVLGVALSWQLSRFLRGMLFEIGPGDPVALLGAMAALVAVAVLATLVPARRAARIDPVIALRAD